MRAARFSSRWLRLLAAGSLTMTFPALAAAAEFDGGSLSPLWGVPFAGLLLSIALLPLMAPSFWHHHYGKVSAAWSLAFLLPFGLIHGAPQAGAQLVHALLAEYIPFIILLAALYAVAGGIHIRGNLRGSAGLNTAILAIGAVLASLMGTTGASMLLIRPLIRANDNRRHKVHVVVFFIFIVSNVGGSLTPLGDPPLFLGFLKGVEFFWTARNIFPDTLFLVGALLALFYALDRFYFRHEGVTPFDPTPDTRSLGFAIFDAETGERLHEFAMPLRFQANRVAWEDDEHLLMSTTQVHTQAILRTTLDGAIQRATEAAPYDPEGQRFGLAPNLFP